METTRQSLIELMRFHCTVPKQKTPIPGLTLFRSDAPTEPVRSLYDPRLCVVLQGRKELILEREHIEIGPSDYLVVVLDLPVTARVAEANPHRPHYAITLDLDPAIIAELVADKSERRSATKTKGAAIAGLTADILEPLERLVRLLDRPKDIETLAPLVQRELFYRLIQGGLGDMVVESGLGSSNLSRIARTTAWIKANFDQPVDVATLADIAGMSQTSYYRAFKAATAMSPLQFRTRLRLHEARRRLQLGIDKIGSIAFAVGYENQSQFNREYRKLFGRSPGADLSR
ncbi:MULTISPECIES: AraC family transcriptional regulator [unclassified Rhizobium]|uniref:AraC family transcriptional regulator n=1 Tax=unclassified Rhizobium TaxID=2613769 RepID=UPI000EA8D036|nr:MULTISPECIES: AraC family transcriptional regulator [unclassified Rhizobium]AYG69934.1 AraC family transcriptional regulator [Rhizobium sp. CCGE531]AYG76310.1 AraC family transcriptional regulator [Rhizobium sp. CCGE532]